MRPNFERAGVSTTKVVRQGFGGYIQAEQKLFRPERISELESLPLNAESMSTMLVCGFGNSYGDAALNTTGLLATTERLNRILAFDATASTLTAEAGVSVLDVMKTITPRGFSLPATPGYSRISLGGCTAFDIHSKNHWRVGGFGDCVLRLRLLLANGSIHNCSRTENADLFYATIGGMGLTGVILDVTVKLDRLAGATILNESVPFHGVSELLSGFETEMGRATHLVAWLDLLNRRVPSGHLIVSSAGEETELVDWNRLWSTERNPPLELVSPFFNTASNRLFNLAYALKHHRTPIGQTNLRSFLFPWDALPKWNRLYGKHGFVEYQCCVPVASAGNAIDELLGRVLENRSRFPAYFAAVKRVRDGQGMLSFPMDGYSILLDFPVREGLWTFLDELDEIVVAAGGRVYLAKDGRLSASAFHRMYPRLDDWKHIRASVDPCGVFASDMARRLQLVSH